MTRLEEGDGPLRLSVKCAAAGCTNHSYDGDFNGEFCSVCCQAIKTGDRRYTMAELSKTYTYVYDLDGTLVDTKAANEAAYALVGVTPPTDHHVRPWETWCTRENHDLKALALPQMLRRFGQGLPLLTVAHGRLRQGDRVMVLSNASSASMSAMRAAFPVLRQIPTLWEMRPDDKMAWLRSLACPGCYSDDSVEFCARVRAELPTWKVVEA